MPKYTTPPSWYDKNGNLNEMLAGTSGDSTGIAIGKFASVNGEYGVAVGINASVNGGYSVAIGESAGTLDSAIGGIAIGKGAKANEGDSIAIGEDAKGEVVYGIAIGSGAKANADSTDGIAIGRGTTSSQGGIAIGGSVEAAGIGSIAIGAGASTDTDSNKGIAIGSGAISTMGGIAIGAGADAIGNKIQLGNNDTAYTLNIGNGNASIGNFEITPIKTGDYANQVVLGNINQIKAPMAGISFEVGERREVGTIIFPSKIKTLMVDSIQYSVGAISKTSTNGSLNLSANCLYVINFGSFRAMLHTTTNNSTTHQFIYSIDSTTDYVIYVNNVLSDTTSVTCKLQKYNKSNNTYTDYTDSNFTAIKVCSFT